MDWRAFFHLVLFLIIQPTTEQSNPEFSYRIHPCRYQLLENGQIVSGCSHTLRKCIRSSIYTAQEIMIDVKLQAQTNTAVTISDLLSNNVRCGTLKQITITFDDSLPTDCSFISASPVINDSFIYSFQSLRFFKAIIRYPDRNDLISYRFDPPCIRNLTGSKITTRQDLHTCEPSVSVSMPTIVDEHPDIYNLTTNSAVKVLKKMAANWLASMNGTISSLELRTRSTSEIPQLYVTIAYNTSVQDYIEKLTLRRSSLVNITTTSLSKPFLSVKELDLSNNKIRNIDPKFFSMVPNLEVLDLSKNSLTAFPLGLDSSKHLTDLHIGGNDLQLGNLSREDIGMLQNVTTLSLSATLFKEADLNALQHMSHLRNLFLRNCRLSSIPADLFLNYSNLTHLDLSHNQLSSFPKLAKLPALTHLNLSRNRFQSLKNVVDYPEDTTDCGTTTECTNQIVLDVLDLSRNEIVPWNKNIISMSLAISHLNLTFNEISEVHQPMMDDLEKVEHLQLHGNRINCFSCSLRDFQHWILAKANDSDLRKLVCERPPILQDQLLLNVEPNLEFCLGPFENTDVYIIVSSAIIVASIVIGSICYGFKGYMSYLFSLLRKLIRRLLSFLFGEQERTEENDFEFDAFVSYCHSEECWVANELVPNAESKHQYKLCLHERDFMAGELITNNILRSIKKSRKVLLILSNNFLQSQWCQWELRMAHHQLFETDRKVLVLIKLEELEKKKISKTLRSILKTQTYLKWGESAQAQTVFWLRLKDCLGDPLISYEKESQV